MIDSQKNPLHYTEEEAAKLVMDHIWWCIDEGVTQHPDNPREAARSAFFVFLVWMDGCASGDMNTCWDWIATGPADEDIETYEAEGERYAPKGLRLSSMFHEMLGDRPLSQVFHTQPRKPIDAK